MSATTITVENIDEFDEDGGSLRIGTETYAYTVPVDSTGQINLSSPLVTAHLAGEDVVFLVGGRQLVERFAYVQAADQEEEIQALVPHALIDTLDLGARNGDGEQVEIGLRGEDVVVVDVIGKELARDGSFIDPDTVPPPGTDGDPPDSSPTPTVRGAIGALVLDWTAITNHDPVTYEVHISTSSGFAPSVLTYVTETPGVQIWIRTVAGGAPLAYGVTYFVRLVAKDADGVAPPSSEASGQIVQVSSGDIAVDTILANHILAGEITAEKLAAVLVIASEIKTAQDGQRVEIDPHGIRLIGQDEKTLVDLPTDPGIPATFSGQIYANALTVFDRLSVQGANNALGGTLTVTSQLPDPANAPVVEIANSTFTLDQVSAYPGDYGTHRGLFYDSSGDGGTPSLLSAVIKQAVFGNDTQDIILFEHSASGAFKRKVTIPQGGQHKWSRVCGVTRRGGIIYVLAWKGEIEELRVIRVRQSDLTILTDAIEVQDVVGQVEKWRATIGTIASDRVSIFSLDPGTKQIKRTSYADNDTSGLGTWSLLGAAPYTGLNFNTGTGGDTLQGHVRVGTQDWFAHDKDGVHGANSFDSSLALETETGFITSSQGIAYDTSATRFRSRANERVTQHTNWTWTDTLKYLVYAYEWWDGGSPGTQTLPSPQRAFNLRPDGAANRAYRRSRVKITVPTFPSGVPRIKLFLEHSATQTVSPPSLLRAQSASFTTPQTDNPIFQSAEDPGTFPPATTNNWPGNDGHLKSQVASWDLSGSDAKGLLSLLSVVKRRVDFGSGTISVGNLTGGTATVSHGLGVIPQVVLVSVASNTGGSVNAIVRAYGWQASSASFTVAVTHRDLNANFAAGTIVTYTWLAIG